MRCRPPSSRELNRHSTTMTDAFKAAVGAALLASTIACAQNPLPAGPDPALIGCYAVEGELPDSYADSLGYHVPDVLQLAEWGGNQWVVFPTSFEWHPNWTAYDRLPSGRERRQRRDPPHFIPGDSIDVYFPGPIGSLVLRLTESEGGLAGRSEWVGVGPTGRIGASFPVDAPRASCADLPTELRRTR